MGFVTRTRVIRPMSIIKGLRTYFDGLYEVYSKQTLNRGMMYELARVN